MKKLILIFLLLFSMGGLAFAQPNTSCKNDDESLICIRSSLKAVTNEMKKVILNIEESTDNLQKFQISQLKWLAYKNAYCKDFMGEEATNAQGDGATIIIESCLLDIDKARLDELKRLNKFYLAQ
ncbi:lysozyme inhibitor LprI family protein [Acinetobacter bereziniae]|uniref:lysozyme inhibitor LprI family protein n=1 Tax=Acinetobacter bereziniae TaxID=106648 RepID=UPI00124CAD26|nr:lysozyme inhibitor LprI family protein [Acinetobacter bereziniae]